MCNRPVRLPGRPYRKELAQIWADLILKGAKPAHFHGNGPSRGKLRPSSCGAVPGATRHEYSIRPIYSQFPHNPESGLPVRSFYLVGGNDLRNTLCCGARGRGI
jgi:hypothetical protein